MKFQLHHPPQDNELIPLANVAVYRVHVGHKIYGPVKVSDLRRIPGFTLQTPISPYGTEHWQPAYKVIDLQKYFNKPVNNSFTAADFAAAIKSLVSDSPDAEQKAPPPTVVHSSRLSLRRVLVSSVLLTLLFGGAGTGVWNFLLPNQKKEIVRFLEKHTPVSQAQIVHHWDRLLSKLEP